MCWVGWNYGIYRLTLSLGIFFLANGKRVVIRPWASSGIKDPLPLMAASGEKYSHHFLSAYGKNMNAPQATSYSYIFKTRYVN